MKRVWSILVSLVIFTSGCLSPTPDPTLQPLLQETPGNLFQPTQTSVHITVPTAVRITPTPTPIQQNHIPDSDNIQDMVTGTELPKLRGVARPSLEWWRPEWGFEHVSQHDMAKIRDWGANVVRLPLNQRSYRNYPEYQGMVSQIVEWNTELGMYTILDLHWSEKGDPNLPIEEVGQQVMPNQLSLEFWRNVAETYGNNGWVIFELYNEPHDVSPEVWAYGGSTDGGSTTEEFEAVGMQGILDAIRETGADNWVIVNGLDWGYDFRNLPLLEGTGIMLGAHLYGNHNHKDEPSEWDQGFGFLKDSYPIVISEFGNAGESCDGSYDQSVVDYAEENNFGWVAWAWYPQGCDFPSLITDWDGTPSPSGEVIKENFRRFNK